MRERPPSGCTQTPEAAGEPLPRFISGASLAHQHVPTHAGSLRGHVVLSSAFPTERTFIEAQSSHAMSTAVQYSAAQTPLAPNNSALTAGTGSVPSPSAVRTAEQVATDPLSPQFSPSLQWVSHLMLARLGTVFRGP